MITEDMAKSVVKTKYSKLPDEVIFKAKLCFLDFLAVAVRGSQTPSGNVVKQIFKSQEEATVLGSNKLSIMDASFCNGVFAHSLDLDDGHRFAQLHPGCVVIPAAMAAAELYQKTGKELLQAIVAGYQVSISLGRLVNPMHRNNGFHSTGTCGTIGAAAAVCKIMELPFEKIVNALGLAGTQAAGLLESDHSGSMAKHLHAGKAAQAGVLSAILAENDFTGAKSIIDGKQGFYRSMVSSVPASNIETNWKKLDTNYHILDVYFKKYPFCRHLHSSIDASLTVKEKMETEEIKLNEICSIKVKTYKIAAEHDIYHAKTDEEIRQSLPFAVAISLIRGAPNINTMDINHLTRQLASNIAVEVDTEFEQSYPNKRSSEVSVITEHNVYKSQIDLPCGEPENPFGMDDLQKKFQELNPHFNIKSIYSINEIESIYINDFLKMLNLNIK